MNAWIYVGLVALAALVGGYWIYQRQRARQSVSVFYCRCPSCERKLHYHPERAGRTARCPACKKPFTYPALPPEEEAMR